MPAVAALWGLAGCPGTDSSPMGGEGSSGQPPVATETSTGSSTDAPGSSDGADTTGSPLPPDDDALDLLEQLPGLWVAPVTSTTSVGDFPIMAMDIRPADDRTLFSRVDLDADNNLRFAFTVEEHDGQPTLVFRNGGEFLGLLRDTRSVLVDHDPKAQTWRFCAVTAGCGYVEAEIRLDDPERVVLSAAVLGRPHMYWEGIRREQRMLDGDFPYDTSPGGSDDPFPDMPALTVSLSWTEAVAEPTWAWVILSTSDCGVTPGSCWPSRFLRVQAPAGATSVEVPFEQIHGGDYLAIAVLDRNDNLAGTLFPDAGDLVSLPNQPVEVAPSGESTEQLVLFVEL
ncbi:MAG: hypothetical protein K0V04_25865 [Deltaproteobacteria bacterium]|nr:hypothetical protein [Deltaproteobacteria bacterium]